MELTEPQLILLGGLPGSGKSTKLKELNRNGWVIFDDFQAGAANNSSDFKDSQEYGCLISSLQDGHRCVVADIRIIQDCYRVGALAALNQDLGLVATQTHLFTNEPEQCRANVLASTDKRDKSKRLDAIAYWSRYHSIPEGVTVVPVWNPSVGGREEESGKLSDLRNGFVAGLGILLGFGLNFFAIWGADPGLWKFKTASAAALLFGGLCLLTVALFVVLFCMRLSLLWYRVTVVMSIVGVALLMAGVLTAIDFRGAVVWLWG